MSNYYEGYTVEDDEWSEMRQAADPLGYFLHEWDRYLDGRIAYDQLPRRFPGARLVDRVERMPDAGDAVPEFVVNVREAGSQLPRAVARYRR